MYQTSSQEISSEGLQTTAAAAAGKDPQEAMKNHQWVTTISSNSLYRCQRIQPLSKASLHQRYIATYLCMNRQRYNGRYVFGSLVLDICLLSAAYWTDLLAHYGLIMTSFPCCSLDGSSGSL